MKLINATSLHENYTPVEKVIHCQLDSFCPYLKILRDFLFIFRLKKAELRKENLERGLPSPGLSAVSSRIGNCTICFWQLKLKFPVGPGASRKHTIF